MKRIATLIMATILLLVLTGCQCSHQWTEADCLTPKTCTKCEETEGEALGHAWADATCAAPKTCANCGLTEGEALVHTWTDATCAAPKTCANCSLTEGETLPHTWMDANYQAPQTCTQCGATEGDPWLPDFEKHGFVIDELEVGVPYSTVFQDDLDFEICITSYEVYESDETHEAREGYEWRTLTYTAKAPDYCSAVKGNLVYADYNNYYEMEEFFSSMAGFPSDALVSSKHTINYNGEDCEYLFLLEKSYLYNDNQWLLEETMSFQVPVGFDGAVLCIGDYAKMQGNYADLYMDMYADESTVFFRLK